MTDSIKYGDLVMNQGTSNHFQSSTDFEKNLNLLKHYCPKKLPHRFS